MEMITSLAKPIGPKRTRKYIDFYTFYANVWNYVCVINKKKMHILDENIIPYRGCDDRETYS